MRSFARFDASSRPRALWSFRLPGALEAADDQCCNAREAVAGTNSHSQPLAPGCSGAARAATGGGPRWPVGSRAMETINGCTVGPRSEAPEPVHFGCRGGCPTPSGTPATDRCAGSSSSRPGDAEHEFVPSRRAESTGGPAGCASHKSESWCSCRWHRHSGGRAAECSFVRETRQRPRVARRNSAFLIKRRPFRDGGKPA
jgi:hypothetical protein